MSDARVDLIHLGLPEDHGVYCQCGLGEGGSKATRLGPDGSEDFHADKGLHRTVGGKRRAQNRACATFNRQARFPDSCHCDTPVSWTSSQRTGRVVQTWQVAPILDPVGNKALAGASTSRFKG